MLNELQYSCIDSSGQEIKGVIMSTNRSCRKQFSVPFEIQASISG